MKIIFLHVEAAIDTVAADKIDLYNIRIDVVISVFLFLNLQWLNYIQVLINLLRLWFLRVNFYDRVKFES